MGRLDGRIAIITGGGRGIGRATAELFAAEGAKIVVASLSEAPGQEVVDGIVAKGGEAIFVQTDVGDREAVRNVVARTASHFGGIDIVVHNAAYIPHADIADLSDRDLDKTFDAGVKAAFWFTRDALPFLLKSAAPRILLTSSIAAVKGNIGLAHYSAVKAALNGFVIGAGLELARRGITVNAIAPGLTLGHQLQVSASPAVIDALSARIPINRPAQPIEQAKGFLYLASDDAKYVTGHVLTIDGGAILGDPNGLGLDQI